MKKIRKILFIFLGLFCCFPCLADTYIVDQNGLEDFTTIQAAIDAASDGYQIEVAPGTYNEAIDFKGKAIRLYSRSGPDVTTIDASGVADVYHVVQCVGGEDANTILEGFTITGGDASGPDTNDVYGGGMFNDKSSPTVTDCNFLDNFADWNGGGMYNYYCSPNITNCIFSQNTAGTAGGGMYNDNSNPAVTNCTFIGNSNTGMYNFESNPAVTGCTFSSNLYAIAGGGMYNNNSSPTVTDCNFSQNSVDYYGGGMNNSNNSSPTVTGCTFSGNLSSYHGGGMYNQDSSPIVSDCTFRGNYTYNFGSGIFNDNSNLTVTNCIFSNNSVTRHGGGMFNYYSSATVTNCTFSKNSAGTSGGGIYNNSYSSLAATNCILWGNSPDEIYDSSGSAAVTYSDIKGGFSGTGNKSADPKFVDAVGGNVRIMSGSPCIDAGNNGAVPVTVTFDLNGWSRFIDDLCTSDTGSGTPPIVDMGAYEFLSSDIDSNGEIDFADFSLFSQYWMDTNCGICGGADLTCDGDIDFDDLQEFSSYWLEGTP